MLPEKCVNYAKSNLQQNSAKGPKDQTTAKKPKNNIKFQNVAGKKIPKSMKLRHYSLSRQNSLKFCKDFTKDRIFYTNIGWHVFTSLEDLSNYISFI